LRRLGRYELVDELGRGGAAIVYLARDTATDRAVAVKVLAPQLPRQGDVLTRFQREIKLAVQLEHPHIVPIFDVGVEDDQPYIVLRLLTGGSLADRIQYGPVAVNTTLDILQQVASALDAAHARKIIHRDVKPANILFDTAGAAYLGDFGIARALDATTTPMNSWAVGTPAFMSPEQLRGQPIDARTDEYALGIVAFTMLTGSLPYEGTTAHIITQQLLEPLPNIRLLNPVLPASIQGVLERATAKEPADRYASAGEFVKVLGDAAQGWLKLGGTTPVLSAEELAPARAPVLASAEASVAEPAPARIPAPAPEAHLSLGPAPTLPAARPAVERSAATHAAPALGPSRPHGRWLVALGALILLVIVLAGWRLGVFAGAAPATQAPTVDPGTPVAALAVTPSAVTTMTPVIAPTSLPFMATLASDAIGLAIITLPPGTGSAALCDRPLGTTLLLLPDRTIVQVLRGRQVLPDNSAWVAVRAPDATAGWVAEALLTYLTPSTATPAPGTAPASTATSARAGTTPPATAAGQPTSPIANAAPSATEARAATPGATARPAASPLPGSTNSPTQAAVTGPAPASPTRGATGTSAVPSATLPLATNTPAATATPAPSSTPAPTHTNTPVPSNTPILVIPTLPNLLGTLIPGLP